jgi:hypothetical protein|tara:strand:- start:3738 stop:4655 length:918 start_codon:yes stop_codon:yes gene_type:complete
MKKSILFTLALLATSVFGHAQYNSCAGKSEVMESRTIDVRDETTGEMKQVVIQEKVKKVDGFGNATGNKYDLAVDGAFEGQTVVVLHFYTGQNFNFELPKAALAEKGLSVYRFSNAAPTPEVLEEALSKACQLWVISTSTQLLNDEHAEVIKKFFESGKGVYLWGDNDPFHADADFLASKLMGVTMDGGYSASKNVTFKTETSKEGMRADHLITTGLEYVFEGVTIAKINDPNQALTPLIWSTDGNVVTSIYEQDGKRLIIDGGFTRLYCNWDSAGTGRYVKNAAAWLVNYERFGEAVVSENLEK